MREIVYKIIKKAEQGETISKFYDAFIVTVAFVSLLPLMFKGTHPILERIDLITVYILFADYIFHWITCDYFGKTKGTKAFIKYPFTPFALLDLISLLPSMGLVSPSLRMLRIFRISKMLRYSDNYQYIAKVIRKEKTPLISVLYISVFYIFASALIMFAHEPDTFDSFFDACYWATMTLTTVGYGDFYPVSDIGKLISMISSLFGIAVIALPAGIVTAGFVDELHNGPGRPERTKLSKPREPVLAKIFTPAFKRGAVIMMIGVLMDSIFSSAARFFGMPVWLDVTGTAFVAIVLGPVAGLLVGLVNNFILAATQYGESSLFYYAVSASVALIAGIYLKKDGRIAPQRILPAMFLIIAASTVLSTGIDLWITWGQPPSTYWEKVYYDAALASGVPHIPSCFFGALAVKLYDTVASGMLVSLFCLMVPSSFKTHGNNGPPADL